jgi:hypothetical protein
MPNGLNERKKNLFSLIRMVPDIEISGNIPKDE